MVPFVERQALMKDLSVNSLNAEEVELKRTTRLCIECQDDCAICLDPLFKTKIVETPCNHKFHPSCIE